MNLQWAMIRKTCILVVIVSVHGVSLTAGEWMFRLRDAHVQLRQALFDQNADAAWEHVDRSTRQQAGLLAARIRNHFDALSDNKKQMLREKLGIRDDAKIRKVQGKDLLVANFFLEAHPYLLTGDRNDIKLKDHGTRMAGPTGIVVHKKTPDEIIVPYRFTTESHFGGQAMDYRAQLDVPTLDVILGSGISKATLSQDEIAQRAVLVFPQARQAFARDDLETFWSLLDCDSQSQASHFADQARQRANDPERTAEIQKRLSISREDLATLDGKRVWALPWAREQLSYFKNAANPKYVPADQYDQKLVPVPIGYNRRDKASPEAMIEFQAEGRSWQIPARLNYRNGTAEVKLFIRPPFYLRLRQPKG